MKLNFNLLSYFLIIIYFFSSCSHFQSARNTASDKINSPYALMSPYSGEEAFNILYDRISRAKKTVFVTVYSWSDSGLDKALETALNNNVKVRVILNPDIKPDNAKYANIVPFLESKGAEFKRAPKTMHEKFTLVDDEFLFNTSANFSSGAKNKYSENMIFHELEKDSTSATQSLINDFKNEFAVMWNTSKDIITRNESLVLPITEGLKSENIPTENTNMTLYSSSMNWTLKKNIESTTDAKSGRVQNMVKKMYPNTKDHQWTVRDIIIKNINAATTNIYLSLNHFNIKAVSDALIEAVKRGVNVQLAVDNQEYKIKPNNLEMSPQFVQDWALIKPNIIPPIRVKYYSHEPSPRNWLLNHHKFILIDYGVSSKTILLSGSYNLSKNAEQDQFDSLVQYKTDKYDSLYKSFYDEFQALWLWNRINDQPKKEILDLFTTATADGSYPLHIQQAVSLNWSEIISLRTSVNKLAPGLFSRLGRNKDCLYYNPKLKTYSGCMR